MSDEFDNKEDKTQGQETTQYSFWAEQVASKDQGQTKGQNQQFNPYYNGNLGGNQQYQQFNQDNMPKKKRRKSHNHNVIKIILGAACFGVIAGATFLGVNELYYHFNPEARTGTFNENTDGRLNTLAPNKEHQLLSTSVLTSQVMPDTDVTQVYKDTLPSIVAINSTVSQSVDWFGQIYNKEAEGSGSGIIVGETDTELLIATNNHVVDGAIKIQVTFIDGSKQEAIVKGTDASADLAVIAIDIKNLKKDTIQAIKVAALGNSDTVKEGEMAIAIGNALGYGQSMTVGYISAKNRTVEFETGSMELLQTDAAINPGNSGGALLNVKGEVIGINCAKLARNTVEGMGYAIPISKAIPIINELMSREIIKEADQGYMGIVIKPITEDIHKMYNIPMGVYVVNTQEDGAAKKSGIYAKDIITGINGVEVTSPTGLIEKISSYKYGTKVTITLQRNENGEYVEKTVEVTLGKRPVAEKEK